MKNWNRIFEEGPLRSLLVMGLCVVTGILVHFVVFFALKRVAQKTKTIIDDSVAKHSRAPLMLSFVLVFFQLGWPLVSFHKDYKSLVQKGLAISLIISVAWLLIRLTKVGKDLVTASFDVGMAVWLDW